MTAFLLFVLTIGVGVFWNRQIQLNNALERNQVLNDRLMDLMKEKTDLLKEKTNLLNEKTKWVQPCQSDQVVADMRHRVEELVRENEKLSVQVTTLSDAKVPTDRDINTAKKESLDQQIREMSKQIERLEAEAGQLREKVSQFEREKEGSSIRYKECSDQLIAVRQELQEVRKRVEDQLRDNGRLTQELSQCKTQLNTVTVELTEAKSRPHHHHPHGHHHHHPHGHHHHHGHGHHHHHGHGHHCGHHHH